MTWRQIQVVRASEALGRVAYKARKLRSALGRVSETDANYVVRLCEDIERPLAELERVLREGGSHE